MEKYNKNDLEKKEDNLANLIGFDVQVVDSIEDKLNTNNLNSPEEFYLCGLQEEAINTSLLDFYEILIKLNELENGREIIICDIGASYAKMAFIANHFFPNIKVISVEPVKERIVFAINKLTNSKHIFINNTFNKDLIKNDKVNYFFLYFPVGETLDEIITQIDAPIIAIESHGELINRLGHSFSNKKKLTKLIFPRHNPHSYLFSNKEETSLYKAFKAFQNGDNDLIVINDQRPWLAEFEGLEHYFDEEDKITLELKSPPRTIHFSDNLKTIKSSELDTNVQEIISMRREGKQIDGCFIRKIFMDGSFELSSGVIRK